MGPVPVRASTPLLKMTYYSTKCYVTQRPNRLGGRLQAVNSKGLTRLAKRLVGQIWQLLKMGIK